MPKYAGLLVAAWALLLGGVLFYVLSVAGLFWPKPTPPTDIGLWAMTAMFLLFGVGAWLLRQSKLHPGPAE